jgi:hypothetical protein
MKRGRVGQAKKSNAWEIHSGTNLLTKTISVSRLDRLVAWVRQGLSVAGDLPPEDNLSGWSLI